MAYAIDTTARAAQAARFNMTEAEYVILKSRNQIISTDPFFATLVLSLPTKKDDKVEAMATNGICIIYNEGFVKSLTLDECKGVLAHEALHCAMLHHLRREGRDPEYWNIACDYAINGILIEAGYVLPKGALHDKQYNGMSAEEIYGRLQRNPGNSGSNSGNNNLSQGVGNNNGQGNSSGQMVPDPSGRGRNGKGSGSNTGNVGNKVKAPAWGRVNDYDPHVKDATGQAPTTTEKEQNAVDWNIISEQAKKSAKAMGSQVGPGVERLLSDVHTPKISWREIIARFVEEIAHNNYSWQRPNTRYIQRGIILPSLQSKTYGQVLVAVDTSGSASPDDIAKMVSEVVGIIELYEEDRGGVQLPVIYCDNQVRNIEWLGLGDVAQPKGGGGTSFRPVFEWLKENGEEAGVMPKAIIYLTDGYCNRYPDVNDVEVPVVWCLTQKNPDFKPPFGEVTRLSDE